MGKQSKKKSDRRQKRKKREFKLKQQRSNTFTLSKAMARPNGFITDMENRYSKSLRKTKEFLHKYNSLDAALAISVSDLWPANTGSPIKHIFAWRLLIEDSGNEEGRLSISSYVEFKGFIQTLYSIWPEFQMLEDFSPEADWGQVKARLGADFVPMFYGSCIERTPDFVEAFRITFAHIPEALADMDLVIALQAQIISSISSLITLDNVEVRPGDIEIPSEDFWNNCRSVLLQVGNDISGWRSDSSAALDAHLGDFKISLDCSSFSAAAMEGAALPFLALESSRGAWVPMSVRSAPGVVIDHWVNKIKNRVSAKNHIQLAELVSKKFSRTISGPLQLWVDSVQFDDITISCAISAGRNVYLVCLCDYEDVADASNAIKKIRSLVKQGGVMRFRMPDNRGIMLSKDGKNGPNADELRIIIVVSQRETAPGFIDAPEKPTRLFYLADFISIFESLGDLNELERYWEFVESNTNQFSLLSSGATDLYASFRDTHGVLVEGADNPSMIFSDPHWGTSWRFNEMVNFWSLAPDFFPNGTTAWQLSNSTEGVVRLLSRTANEMAYSTKVGGCTFQVIVRMEQNLQEEDARVIDLFAQILSDSSFRSRDCLQSIPLFQRPHVLVDCTPAPNSSVSSMEIPAALEEFDQVVISASEDLDDGVLHLQVDLSAVFSGLNESQNASFEIRCLLETLACCHKACRLEFPSDLKEQLNDRVTDAARFQLNVVDRNVDVPDYVKPVIPSLKEYKMARRRLAEEMKSLGLTPGRYELSDAKAMIDPASNRLKNYIESQLLSLDRKQLIKALIEQHDGCLLAERQKIQQAQMSLSHDVEYDRLEMVEQARKDFGSAARHYRYLLEKTIGLSSSAKEPVTSDVLRKLVGLVDWYMVLTGASDYLHNRMGVGGVDIDDSFIPEVFYSADSNDRNEEYAHEYASQRIGLGVRDGDSVQGALKNWLSSEKLKNAFMTDVGFDLGNLLTSLVVLAQAQRHGFDDDLLLSYVSNFDFISKTLVENVAELELVEAEAIVEFLTLSEKGVLRLSGRDVEETEVPYWEHRKRVHRYAIRPLITDGSDIHWGAETASRALNIWSSAISDGYLPADFNWPNVELVVREIKKSIEQNLELRSEEIFKRYTPYVLRGIDFFRKFRGEKFEDVGDFDVFAYWPEENLLVTVECKYNQPPHTLKDGRRLRDKIFGKSEDDRSGQISRILGRRKFLEKHRARLLELVGWPESDLKPEQNEELYVSRDVYYWMVHTPYPIPTKFVRVEVLDSWIKEELTKQLNYV